MVKRKKAQKDKQRSTKHTHKTKDRVKRTPLKIGGELMRSGRIGSYTITCRLNTDPEIPVTRLGEPWTHHFCIGITFFANNKRGCTSGTHDVLVGTHQNVII